MMRMRRQRLDTDSCLTWAQGSAQSQLSKQREREILITRAAKVSMDGRISAICCHRDRVINSVPILFEHFFLIIHACVGHDDDGDHLL